MSAISLKQFDTARTITDLLKIGTAPVNLTGTTVKIRFYDIQRRTMWERNAVITDAPAGLVAYTPQAADVQYAGPFQFEWRIQYPDATILTAPTEGRNELTIFPAIVPTS